MKLTKIQKLEKELEEKLKDHNKPIQNNTWVPYEKFVNNIKENKKKNKPKQTDDTIRQMNLDLATYDTARNTRRQYERQALVNFKETFIYADEYDDLNNSTGEEHDTNYLNHILINKLKSEYTRVKDDKTGKYSLKAFIEIKCLMVHDDGKVYKNHYFKSEIYNIVSINNISDIINNIIDEFNISLEVAKDSSKWTFVKFLKFTIATQRFKSVLGKSYIKLPQNLINKKACVNIKNEDDKCFEYCLIASRVYDSIKAKDKNEVYHYVKRKDAIQRPDNITYPIITDDIPLYEEINDIQINVFSLNEYNDDTKDIREYIVEEYKSDKHRKEVVNLLLVRDGDLSHYVLIKNINRLFASKTNRGHTKHICENCLVKSFNTVELLNKHKIKCQNLEGVDVPRIDVICECPEEGKNTLNRF